MMEKPQVLAARPLVVRGSRNLFTVRVKNDSGGEEEIECRIKGKILKGVEGYYNPLAPGDFVEIEGGQITGLAERRNKFARFNQKGQAPQLLAANVDIVFCVCSFSSPPFRPRFLDRALVQAEAAEIPSAIVCNKYDLAEEFDADVEERLSDYERIGYRIFRLSAITGAGLDELRRFMSDKLSVFVGQSGVGKSSLVNALIPGLDQKTGDINEKYDRGIHTTTQGVLLEGPAQNGTGLIRLIDTPGIRRFALAGIPPGELVLYMSEFAPLAGKCGYGLSCSHETEPGCKIMEAVAAGIIHEDRYDSYLRIREELSGTRKFPDYD